MGNFYRGTTKTDRIQTCRAAPSIPTKHQRAVINIQERKGFSCQTKRLPAQISLNENPGPGSYGCVSSAESQSPSFSKKGTAGFVPSKAPRPSSHPHRLIPAPNAYNLQRSFINKHDFSTGASRVFRLPVAVQLDGPKHKTPAPNQYDVHYDLNQRILSLPGTSPFLSTTGRDSFNPNKDVPSPCHYDVNDSITQFGSKVVLSPFKSKTQRIHVPVDNQVPGPGAYSPHQATAPVRRTVMLRRHYLTISAPPVIAPKDPPSPGPGHYDIVSYHSPSKRPVPSAAFASRTGRILQQSKADTGPGPGFYDPQIWTTPSFFYNHSRIWAPV